MIRSAPLELRGRAPAGGGPERGVASEEGSAEEAERKRRLCCAACRQPITDERERITVEGRSLHSFPNPHGILFHFACYREAPGCQPVGEPSTFFCWFVGHSWQIQRCGRCAVHLGWRFQGREGAFYGILEGRLMPCG